MMKIKRTIKLKLLDNPESLVSTFQAYTKAFNYVCQIGWDNKSTDGVFLHNKTYDEVRKYLPSQLACSARVKATEALISVKELANQGKQISCPKSKCSSIRLDVHSYNIWFNKNLISMSTVDGRKKFPIFVPEYFQQYLTWRRKSAELFIRNHKVFINIVFEKEIPDIVPDNTVIGIDRGIKKIAVTSDNRFFGGNHVQQIHLRYQNLRDALQSRGTKSAIRHLLKIAKKENRFIRDTNHCVSKQILKPLKAGTTIALEKLTDIRDSSKKFKKEQKASINRWSFRQLEEFIKYKAAILGIAIAYVDARYTSQKCSKCGHIERGNRIKQSIFKCKHCGYTLNADLNASRNIAKNYLDAISHLSKVDVNQPIVADSKRVQLQAHEFIRG